MRIVRSLLCAGLALVAVGLCAAMPAAAAVPVEAYAIAQPMTLKEYPAPAVVVVHQDEAILPAKAPYIQVASNSGRSSGALGAAPVAVSSFTPPAYSHIDPDIAG
ncbi:hypothetical protein HJA76_14910 [Rhizobium bangladeshense]|uniref:hypothetical protein n=1 Tax=Rhizobium bangladeshense TaxID=1138189 RepID=UPI001C8403B3|nr:hypothetical protein [Rhizobium bangladeshense]MBX4920980.1 hypothetical protein [Rhizobium bangladeshense]